METQEKTGKKESGFNPKSEIQKGSENHKKAATHFEEAAKSHHDAAKHHDDGNHEKAAKSTVEAHGHASLAKKAQKEDVKHHALKH